MLHINLWQYVCCEFRNRIFHLCKQWDNGLFCSGTNAFINFWLRFFDTRRETQFLICWPYYLTPQTHSGSCDVYDLCRLRSAKLQRHASTIENSILCPNGRDSIVCLHGPISISQLPWFLKSTNSQPISSGHEVIHTPALFPIWGVYYGNGDCHILCARA